MRFLDVELDGLMFRARLLEEKAPTTTTAVWDALPFTGRAVHAQVSGAMFYSFEQLPINVDTANEGAGFQYPGLIVLDPDTHELAICYGHGRWNSSTGPLQPIPIAEIGGDLAPLSKIGHALQFDGAKSFTVQHSNDQTSPLEQAPEPKGRKIRIEFGDAVLTATLLEEVSPQAATAFAALLPIKGVGNNTHSSGTLTRFWNADGGSEGETILPAESLEEGQVLLYPGYLYYLPKVGVRGIRIPREATMMRGAANPGGTLRLVPIAKFDGDWKAFRDQAESVLLDGAKPMSISLAE